MTIVMYLRRDDRLPAIDVRFDDCENRFGALEGLVSRFLRRSFVTIGWWLIVHWTLLIQRRSRWRCMIYRVRLVSANCKNNKKTLGQSYVEWSYRVGNICKPIFWYKNNATCAYLVVIFFLRLSLFITHLNNSIWWRFLESIELKVCLLK